MISMPIVEIIIGEEPPESLFMKELKRRGMTPTSLLEESNKSSYSDEQTKYREEDGGFSQRNAVSTNAGMNLTNQREQSMALNSEGLEVGLISVYYCISCSIRFSLLLIEYHSVLEVRFLVIYLLLFWSLPHALIRM